MSPPIPLWVVCGGWWREGEEGGRGGVKGRREVSILPVEPPHICPCPHMNNQPPSASHDESSYPRLDCEDNVSLDDHIWSYCARVLHDC